MPPQAAACEIRLLPRPSSSSASATHPAAIPLSDRPDIPIETRLEWATAVVAAVHSASETPERIRPWRLDLHLDGTVGSRIVPLRGDAYPARFRIPARSLRGCGHRAAVKRAELFALGSLLYALETGQAPFAGIPDGEVQRNYSAGVFPDDVAGLKLGALIAYYWGWATLTHGGEKEGDAANASNPPSRLSRIISKVVSHARDHPVLFFFQATGTLLLVSSLAIPPVLFVVGFGPVGPVVGSAAAAWQASIGLVQAGSLFAWCQSAAMGGAAFHGILATAAVGGGLAGGATVLASVDQARMMERLQAYMTTLKLDEAALILAQANRTLGAGVASAAAGIASLDLSEQRDTVRRVFESARLGGRTLNVICANAAAAAGASGAGTVRRLGEGYQDVAAAAAERRLDGALVGVMNGVAGSARGTVMRLDETFRGLFHR